MKNARVKIETCLYSCLDEGLVQDVARSSPGDVQWSGSATIIVFALVKLKHKNVNSSESIVNDWSN